MIMNTLSLNFTHCACANDESCSRPSLQIMTSTMLEAVLGLGTKISNSNTINIEFGDSGYATALARVLKWISECT